MRIGLLWAVAAVAPVAAAALGSGCSAGFQCAADGDCDSRARCDKALAGCFIPHTLAPALPFRRTAQGATGDGADLSVRDFDGDGDLDVLGGDHLYLTQAGGKFPVDGDGPLFRSFDQLGDKHTTHSALGDVVGAGGDGGPDGALDYAAVAELGGAGGGEVVFVVRHNGDDFTDFVDVPLAGPAHDAIFVGQIDGDDFEDVAVRNALGITVVNGAANTADLRNVVGAGDAATVPGALDLAAVPGFVLVAFEDHVLVHEGTLSTGSQQSILDVSPRKIVLVPEIGADVVASPSRFDVLIFEVGKIERVNIDGGAVQQTNRLLIDTDAAGIDAVTGAGGDVDGDGKNDVVIADRAGDRACILSSGQAPCRFVPLNNPIGIAAGDVDGDGTADLVTLSAVVGKDKDGNNVPVNPVTILRGGL